MTPEQQRIAIAEACPDVIKFEFGIWKWKHTNGTWCCCLWGDPLSDLNAMHEAGKVLTDEQYLYQFLPYLGAIPIYDSTLVNRQIVSATAAQRAEAFLRTLNLWTPS